MEAMHLILSNQPGCIGLLSGGKNKFIFLNLRTFILSFDRTWVKDRVSNIQQQTGTCIYGLNPQKERGVG